MKLQDLVRQSAARSPRALAIKGPDGHLSYGELDALADHLAHRLAGQHIQKGDRVGIWLDKSVRSVVAMQAILRLGAVYVPLDPLSPAARIHTIIEDCALKAMITTRQRLSLFDEPIRPPEMFCVFLEESWLAEQKLQFATAELKTQPVDEPVVGEDELAYILYTSGSTGRPKGVCISHRNALAFVNWVAEILPATGPERFANHAPFHFDLSVLDLYAAFLTGGAVFLIPDGMSYAPQRLVEFVVQEQISVWYSVPSALIMMMERGGLLELTDVPLKIIFFAGEPFPIRPLRQLHRSWPQVRLLNLYGPTETNVCTYYEVEQITEERTEPVPIGRACSGDRVWAMQEDGSPVGPGDVGELFVSGPTVMLGYWGQLAHGKRPYATGDLVRLLEDGNYAYVGRRDQMVKVRGHRIELGDIEAALQLHPQVREAAVIVTGTGLQARIVACITCYTEETPSLLEMKRHCAEHLPRYMIIDQIRLLETLPRTRNGKVDRQALARDDQTTNL